MQHKRALHKQRVGEDGIGECIRRAPHRGTDVMHNVIGCFLFISFINYQRMTKIQQLAEMMGIDPVELQSEYDKIEAEFSDMETWLKTAPKNSILERLSDIVTILPFLFDQEKSLESAQNDAYTIIEHIIEHLKSV